MAVILRYFAEIGRFRGQLSRVAKVRPMLSANKMYPNESTFSQYIYTSWQLHDALF